MERKPYATVLNRLRNNLQQYDRSFVQTLERVPSHMIQRNLQDACKSLPI